MSKYLNSRSNRFFQCGICGDSVPSQAKACKACGADERTGLYGDADEHDTDLPNEEFSYDEFIKREFGPTRNIKRSGLRWLWWVAGVILLAALIAEWF